MTTEKARITKVKFASDLEIECLMLPDGSFGVAAVQATETLGLQPANGHSSRDLKALLGKEFQPAKIATELNPNKSVVLTLEQFALVCVKLAVKGNKVAERLLEIHASASFMSVVSHAFGVKFTQEQAVEWVAARDVHRLEFHPKLTAWLKLDEPERSDYGHQVNLFKLTAGVYTEPVDGYSKPDLKKLTDAYTIYDAMRRRGMNHREALDFI